MMTLRRKNKAQSILDFVMAFGALLVLAIGLVRIWVWFNANYAKLTNDYQNTRLTSGQEGSSATFSPEPLELNDRWVFYGEPSGSAGSFTGGSSSSTATTSGGSSGADTICSNAQAAHDVMDEQADTMRDEADEIDDFVSLMDDWWEYPLRLFFELVMNMDIDDLEDARDELNRYAPIVEQEADEVVAAACGSSTGSYTESDSTAHAQQYATQETTLQQERCQGYLDQISQNQSDVSEANECIDELDDEDSDDEIGDFSLFSGEWNCLNQLGGNSNAGDATDYYEHRRDQDTQDIARYQQLYNENCTGSN